MFIDRIAVADWNNSQWPFTVPAIRSFAEQGLTFASQVTFLVGENGSGKSTLVEAIAERFGIDNRGGHGGRKYAPSSDQEPSILAEAMRMWPIIGNRTKINSYFLRAETAKGVLEFMTEKQVPGYGDRHAAKVSHGESFLQLLDGRFEEAGLYLLDEPETPLSFRSCLYLITVLDDLCNKGSQIICATHSPLVSALPGAQILELTTDGIHERAWSDLDLTQSWRGFLDDPDVFLHHVLDE